MAPRMERIIKKARMVRKEKMEVKVEDMEEQVFQKGKMQVKVEDKMEEQVKGKMQVTVTLVEGKDTRKDGIWQE